MKYPLIAGLAIAGALAMCHAASAGILEDFNAATLVADFQFNDAANTQIESALNSVDPLAFFDDDVDNDDVVTNGTGQLDASGKDNTELGTNYVDIAGFSSGRVLAWFEVSWDFDELVYDAAQDEEFRLSLIQFDPRSTFVTGETFFTRTSATEVELVGNAVGTPSTDTASVVLGSSGNLLTILDANLSAGTLDLYYSADGGASFTQLGGGLLNPGRGVESARLVINEDFSDDSLLIERVAVAVIPEPTTFALTGLAAVLLLGLRRRSS